MTAVKEGTSETSSDQLVVDTGSLEDVSDSKITGSSTEIVCNGNVTMLRQCSSDGCIDTCNSGYCVACLNGKYPIALDW